MANTKHRYTFGWQGGDFSNTTGNVAIQGSCSGYLEPVYLYFTYDVIANFLETDFLGFLVDAFGVPSTCFAVTEVASDYSSYLTIDVEFQDYLANTNIPIITFGPLPRRLGHDVVLTTTSEGADAVAEVFIIYKADAASGNFHVYSTSYGVNIRVTVHNDGYGFTWLDPAEIQAEFDSYFPGLVTVSSPGGSPDPSCVFVTHNSTGGVDDWYVSINSTDGFFPGPYCSTYTDGIGETNEQQSFYFDPPLSQTLDTTVFWYYAGQPKQWNAGSGDLTGVVPSTNATGSGTEADPFIVTWSETGPRDVLDVSCVDPYWYHFNLTYSAVTQVGGSGGNSYFFSHHRCAT